MSQSTTPSLSMPVLEPSTNFAALPEQLHNIAPNFRGIEALYIHVPFCSTKCHYCDFYSLAGHLDESAAFLNALESEIRLLQNHLGTPRPRTLFIGGGTPTLLSPPHLERLIRLIRSNIDASLLEEWTIEANPNTFDREKAAILSAHGINRISFGAQSFIESELYTLQRDHDPENVPRAVDIARNAGFDNYNIDLIFGIPGQTLTTWEFSLARALALSPTHMSCYSLTYEPNTAMTARLKRGEFTPIDEETELAMFQHVYRRLADSSFTRYEVSNYARHCAGSPRACRHNLAYWKGHNWLGLGPSAGTHLSQSTSHNAWRWKNVSSLNHYLAALSAGRLPLTQFESMTSTQWAAEVAAFWLRLADGLDYAEFTDRVGVDVRPAIEKCLQKYVPLHLVELSPRRARILEPGVAVSNRILADALEALSPPPQRP